MANEIVQIQENGYNEILQRCVALLQKVIADEMRPIGQCYENNKW